jgi:hypothetical protein
VPITFEQILADRKQIAVTYQGQTAAVWYRPAAVTPKFMRYLAPGQALTLDQVVAALTELVVDWEVTRRGEPIPIATEQLETLPFDLLLQVFSACLEDWQPDPRLRPRKPSS